MEVEPFIGFVSWGGGSLHWQLHWGDFL